MRALAPLTALLLLAGCIAVPEPEDVEAASVPPAEERIEGMTVEETVTDSIVACESGGGVQIGVVETPSACAQRIVDASGRMGMEHLILSLLGSSGEIVVRKSADDSWSFLATVVVRDATEERAREALDTAWMWSYEKDGAEAIVAAPMPSPPAILGLGPQFVSAAYELAIPAWMAIDLTAVTDNGGITAEDFAFGDIEVETDNGQIMISGSARNVRAATDNGGITAALRPTESGTWELGTDNGEILLEVPEGRRHGYDIGGQFDNGQIIINLEDGDVKTTENGATFRTKGFADRAVQTTMKLTVDNGQIIVDSA